MQQIQINAIHNAMNQILTGYLGVEVTTLDATKVKGYITSTGVSVILGLKGDWQGQLICSFSKHTAYQIIGTMMGGMQISEIDEMGWSAVEEFGNWIAGSAATELSNEGYFIDVTPPVINEGNSHFHSQKELLSLPHNTPIGSFEVHINLEKVV